MPDDSFLGLDFKLIVAGAAGGLSIIYSMKKPEAWELIAGLVVGGLVANYVTPVIADTSKPWALLVAFIIGTAGKWLCRRFFDYVKSRTPFKER
jgi:F0F1-type ATP synthase assembly protein I